MLQLYSLNLDLLVVMEKYRTILVLDAALITRDARYRGVGLTATKLLTLNNYRFGVPYEDLWNGLQQHGLTEVGSATTALTIEVLHGNAVYALWSSILRDAYPLQMIWELFSFIPT